MNEKDETIIFVPPTPPALEIYHPRVSIEELLSESDSESYTSDESDHENIVDDNLDWSDQPLVVDETGPVDMNFRDGFLLRAEFLPDFGIQCEEPLYAGCLHTTKDYCRYMLAMKEALHLGDTAFSVIAGAMVSFLPVGNVLSRCLLENPSVYKLLQAIRSFAALRYV